MTSKTDEEKSMQNTSIKLVLLALLVVAILGTISIVLTQQNSEQFASNGSRNIDTILQQQQLLIDDQITFASQLDQKIQAMNISASGANTVTPTDTAPVIGSTLATPDSSSIANAALDNADIQTEQSLLSQANAIEILPTDELTTKLQKNIQKISLITAAVKKKVARKDRDEEEDDKECKKTSTTPTPVPSGTLTPKPTNPLTPVPTKPLTGTPNPTKVPKA